MESILFSKENGIATITLNRPDKFNSVTKEIAMGMQQFLKESAEDSEVRCIVITAKEKHFVQAKIWRKRLTLIVLTYRFL